MEYNLSTQLEINKTDTDCIIVAVYEDNTLSPAASEIDKQSNQAISTFLETGDFTAKLKQVDVLYAVNNMAASRIMLVGCGKQDKFNLKKLNTATQAAISAIKSSNIATATTYLADELDDKASAVQQSIISTATELYQFDQHKSQKSDDIVFNTLNFAFSNAVNADIETAIQQGKAIAQGMSLAKDLANTPANICTPSYLADKAQELAENYPAISTEILEEADAEALGMGAFLSVGRGSEQPSKMIVMQYQGAADDVAPIALVGKGITFDTGGISIKPSAAMDEMKYDMGGAASVFGTMQACAEMQLPINVVAVVASAENMPSSKATKPGDIVTSMSGQTIEILNTDAEGRLVLCDALTYVDKFKPDAIIDIATLTGACIIALGHHISGLMANDDKLAEEILAAGKAINDQAWQLPITEDYQNQLKSNFADIPNIGNDRSAGTITAACFLSRFVEDKKWAHLDIAGTAWRSGANKGATGRPVPLLSQLLINRASELD